MDVATEAEMDAAYKKQADMRKRSSGQKTDKDTYLALGKFARSIADKGVPPTVEQQKVIEMEAERQRRIAAGTIEQNVIASEEECLGLTTDQGGATSVTPMETETKVVDKAASDSSESVVYQGTVDTKTTYKYSFGVICQNQ